MRTPSSICQVLVGLAAAAGACRPGSEAPGPATPTTTWPADCRKVAAGEPLADLLERARAGDALCLGAGTWVGRFVVPEGVAVLGGPGSVLRTSGVGTTVHLRSGAALRGVTVDGSGGRFDIVDAAIRLAGDDITVDGTTVKNSIFGILSEKSRRATITSNHVIGTGGPSLGMRGDGIRLWETNDSRVEGNRVEQARDCVIWYSSGNTFRGNRVSDGRYGLHLMYSHRNEVSANVFVGNEVSIFAMYSRNLVADDNQLLWARGPAGMGMGLKESGNVTARGNLVAHNTIGFFLDNSPLNPGDRNVFSGNSVQLSDVGVNFLSSQHDNLFHRNRFKDNHTQVRVDGGGDAMAVTWSENEWSDYVGYDLDGDGIGDLPYELDDLADALEARHLDLAFLRGTPALALVSVAGHVVPLFAPRPVLRDARPWLGAPGGQP
jgi:nitrous oxidase accessory protein